MVSLRKIEVIFHKRGFKRDMNEIVQIEYDDSYPTSVETYSTFRIFSECLEPENVSDILQIKPTRSFKKGERKSEINSKLQYQTNGWFYSTEGLCTSSDTRRHIDMILAILEGKMESINTLHAKGCEMDIVSYWESKGQGGPLLMPLQMSKLGSYGIAVWWDVYFSFEYVKRRESAPK